MTKKKLKEILIASAIGASITFLTQLLDALLGIQANGSIHEVAGVGAGLAYLAQQIKQYV